MRRGHFPNPRAPSSSPSCRIYGWTRPSRNACLGWATYPSKPPARPVGRRSRMWTIRRLWPTKFSTAHTGSNMKRKFEDRTAVITGASKGLGKAMALALAAEGARIARHQRDARPFGGESQRHGFAESFAGAGDDGGAVLKFAFHVGSRVRG